MRRCPMMAIVLITVRGMAQTCWMCSAESGVVVALHPAHDLSLAAACWHEDEPVLALAKDLLVAGGQHVIAEQIAERYSRTLGARYLSNGCHRCSALFGAFFVGETVFEVVASNPTLAAFRLLTTGPVDHAQWTALVDARTSVMG